MLIPRLVVMVATQAHLLSAAQSRSLLNDIEDTRKKYPYVVTLVKEYGRCTGTLITPNWVLTAAHCLSSSSHIQYGDTKEDPNELATKQNTRKILNTVMPPASHIMIPDIGLLYIENVHMEEYGRLSAVDYKALEGLPVEFASFISSNKGSKNVQNFSGGFRHNQVPPLQVGPGLAITCEKKEYTFIPYICMAPKCSDLQQQRPGEAGGPLFFDGKVVAVHTVVLQNHSIRHFTPISPYLSWITTAMGGSSRISFKSKDSRPGDRVLYQRFHNVSRYLYGLKYRLKAYREKVKAALFKQLA